MEDTTFYFGFIHVKFMSRNMILFRQIRVSQTQFATTIIGNCLVYLND